MQSEVLSQSHVWGVLPLQFQSALTLNKSEICRLSGLLEEFGPADGNYTGECEEHKIVEELTGFLVQAVALEAASRRITNGTGRRVGRPPRGYGRVRRASRRRQHISEGRNGDSFPPSLP